MVKIYHDPDGGLALKTFTVLTPAELSDWIEHRLKRNDPWLPIHQVWDECPRRIFERAYKQSEGRPDFRKDMSAVLYSLIRTNLVLPMSDPDYVKQLLRLYADIRPESPEIWNLLMRIASSRSFLFGGWVDSDMDREILGAMCAQKRPGLVGFWMQFAGDKRFANAVLIGLKADGLESAVGFLTAFFGYYGADDPPIHIEMALLSLIGRWGRETVVPMVEGVLRARTDHPEWLDVLAKALANI